MSSLDHTHLVVSTRPGGLSEDEQPLTIRRFACHQESAYSFWREAPPDKEPTCPKCSAAWAKRKAPKVFETLAFEKIEPTPLRNALSLYLVRVSGEAKGYVTIDRGFGRNWRVCSLAVSYRDVDGPLIQGQDLCSRLHSKEAAALALVDLIKAGTAQAEPAVRSAARAALAEAEAQRKVRAEQTKSAAEKRALIVEGLNDLLTQRPGLTNLQIMALENAIRLVAAADQDALKDAALAQDDAA